jgi:hypothetical protein
MGFENPPTEDGAAAPISGTNATRRRGKESSEKEAPRNQGISLMPVNQQKKRPWFGWEPEQGINYTPKE